MSNGRLCPPRLEGIRRSAGLEPTQYEGSAGGTPGELPRLASRAGTKELGAEDWEPLAKALNEPAQMVGRTNTLKIERTELLTAAQGRRRRCASLERE